MPICRDCHTMQPTAEIRRAPKGPKCKNVIACKRRRGIAVVDHRAEAKKAARAEARRAA